MTYKIVVDSERTSALGWLSGIGLGAGLMYFLDPHAGRRRRALVRDKVSHTSHASSDLLRKGSVDLRNRVKGAVFGSRQRLEHAVPDEILVARVRSTMGRWVSHPGAIEVEAENGHVTVKGAILRDEADPMLHRIRKVPGVRGVHDQLERHATADAVPDLQGRGTLQHKRVWEREAWPPAARLVAGSTGLSLTGYALQQRGLSRLALTAAGVALTVRSLTNLPWRRLVGVEAGRRAVDLQKDIHIHAPVEEVFAFFRNFENFPRFMSHLRSVTVHGDRSHWEAIGPAGLAVRWDAELSRVEDGRLLAWRSTPGSPIQSAGIVHFEPEAEGTRVEIHMSYNPPAGALGHAVAHILGRDPKQAMDDDLLRLKSLLEVGKATAHGETVTRNGM